MAWRNCLYCPHTRCVHLSDPNALKNCQLYKGEGINMFRKIWDERGEESGKEGQMLANILPPGPSPSNLANINNTGLVGEGDMEEEETKETFFRLWPTCKQV